MFEWINLQNEYANSTFETPTNKMDAVNGMVEKPTIKTNRPMERSNGPINRTNRLIEHSNESSNIKNQPIESLKHLGTTKMKWQMKWTEDQPVRKTDLRNVRIGRLIELIR